MNAAARSIMAICQYCFGANTQKIVFRLFFVVVICCYWLSANIASAIDNFPRPDFRGYVRPELPSSPPRGVPWEMLDAWMLLVFLLLAVWLTAVRRSRAGLLATAVASVGYFGFLRRGCVCAVGSIQNISLGLADPTYVVPWSIVWIFCLPLLFSLFFGRVFCGGVCPLGAVQELTNVWPIRVPRWLDRGLTCIPWIFLALTIVYAATGTAFLTCSYDPFVTIFRGMQGPVTIVVFAVSLLVVGLFVARPYCRYLCPYGTLLGMCAKIAKSPVRITGLPCHECQLCATVCPVDAILPPTAEISEAERRHSKRWLLISLLLLPLWISAGVLSGRLVANSLADRHPTIQLLRLATLQQDGQLPDLEKLPEIDQLRLEALAKHGTTTHELMDISMQISKSYGVTSTWCGALIGLVFGGKLIGLSLRRRRTGYTPAPSECVACGRCFRYCTEGKPCDPEVHLLENGRGIGV